VRRPPDTATPPEGGATKTTGQGDQVDLDRTAHRWVEEEILGVVEILGAARLTLKAGHLPAVHLRRAAVQLAALDAAVADDLSVVRVMRAEVEELAS
jgi:hypothetical protein